MAEQKPDLKNVAVPAGTMTNHGDSFLYRDVHNYVWKLTPTRVKGDPLTMQVVSMLDSDDVKTANLDPLDKARDSTLSGMQTIKPSAPSVAQPVVGLVNAPGQPHNPAPNAPQPTPTLPVRDPNAEKLEHAKHAQPSALPRSDSQDKPGQDSLKK